MCHQYNCSSFNQSRDGGLRGRSEGQRALKRPDQDLPTVKFDFTWNTAPTRMLRREVNGMLFYSAKTCRLCVFYGKKAAMFSAIDLGPLWATRPHIMPHYSAQWSLTRVIEGSKKCLLCPQHCFFSSSYCTNIETLSRF